MMRTLIVLHRVAKEKEYADYIFLKDRMLELKKKLNTNVKNVYNSV